MPRKLFALFCFSVFLFPLPVQAADASPAIDAALVAQVLALIVAHAWVALAAVLVGLLVRLAKTDWFEQKLAPISARFRPLVAIGLGLVSGALEHAAMHQPWVAAFLGGLVSAAIAVLGHDTVIEGMRGGRELGDGPGPSTTTATFVACAIAGALVLSGCGLPAAYVGEVAGCNGAYGACFDAAAALHGSQAEKAASFVACRGLVDAKCLPMLVPPAPAVSASGSAISSPTTSPSAVPSAAPAPSASASVAPLAAPAASVVP